MLARGEQAHKESVPNSAAEPQFEHLRALVTSRLVHSSERERRYHPNHKRGEEEKRAGRPLPLPLPLPPAAALSLSDTFHPSR